MTERLNLPEPEQPDDETVEATEARPMLSEEEKQLDQSNWKRRAVIFPRRGGSLAREIKDREG